MMLVIYLSSLIRSVIALHNLINNKVKSFCSMGVYSDNRTTLINGFRICKFGFQILNKEHEKTEDAKPTAVPATSSS